jgi:hypothetical protein
MLPPPAPFSQTMNTRLHRTCQRDVHKPLNHLNQAVHGKQAVRTELFDRLMRALSKPVMSVSNGVRQVRQVHHQRCHSALKSKALLRAKLMHIPSFSA